ncbi:nuclear transport factor 2 family protein [Sinorhizobium fredii]
MIVAKRPALSEAGAMDIRSTLMELLEAFNAHDLDRIMACFSDDCLLEMPRGSSPWGSRFEGKQSVQAALATRFEGLPDVHYGNAEHFVDPTADTGISKWILTGTTHEGTRLEVQGCDFYTFRDGKVFRKDSYWKIVE